MCRWELDFYAFRGRDLLHATAEDLGNQVGQVLRERLQPASVSLQRPGGHSCTERDQLIESLSCRSC